MIARKAKPKESILKEVREFVKPAERPMQFIDDDLEPFAEAFSVIKSAAYVSTKLAEEINGYLKWLNRIDNVDWQPPAVLYFTKFHSDPDALLKFVRDLERLASGLLIYRADTNERIDRYGKLIAAIENGTDLHDPTSPLQLTPTETTVIVEKLNGDLYLQKKVVLYVLSLVPPSPRPPPPHTKFPIFFCAPPPPNPPPRGKRFVWFLPEEEGGQEGEKQGSLFVPPRGKKKKN